MKPISVVYMLLLAVCWACQPTSESASHVVSASDESLDLSRTHAVKNTPARMPSGHHEPEVAATGKPPATEDLLTTLPEGVAVPEGMVFVPGGITAVGAEDGLAREQPVIARQIRGFFMDITPVTVAQFREFVQATGYVTQAEKYGDAAVFNMETGEWYLHKGAYWEFPRGPENGPAPPDHPVTQVSYNDALAYCKWAGKRLPTEAEWEHAARNGSNSRSKYSWGEEIFQNGVFKANFWQGHFPLENTLEDGFEFTSPVGAFGETPLGLKDMSGNVWEWCSDWYLPYGNDPSHFIPKPESEKVMRGGSFMCDPSYCWGYRVSGRSGTTPETGLFHVGFRCVKDVE